MNRRLVVLSAAAAAVVGSVVPSFAASVTAPVTVHVGTTNGVAVGVRAVGQPVAAASRTPAVGARGSRQSLPIAVRRDSTGTTVIVGVVGVFVSNNGEVCPLVSTQTWQCISLG